MSASAGTASALVEALLAEHIGLEVESIGQRSIELAVRARLRACKLSDVGEYEQLVKQSRAELAALLEEIVVPETWFFRDAEPFRFVGKLAARWVGAHPHRPFRVLSAPCSTGEEPYSIAMALLDAGLAPAQIHVDAIDVSQVSLARARAGLYTASSFRGDLAGLRERRFLQQPGGEWALAAAVRTLVHFHQGNLVRGDYLHGQAPYQVVFCRNLLIYLTRAARTTVIEGLHARLADGGVIVLGHAEALDRLDARFRPAAESSAFVYERTPAGSARAPLPLHGLGPTGSPATTGKPARHSTPRPAVTPPPELAAPAPAPEPPAAALLASATERAGRGLYADAAALCDEYLRVQGPDAAGYYLLGTIRQASGDAAAATACFERALYLDPGHYESLVHLALLLDQRGERTAAAQLRKRAERVGPGASR
jgi:chemotaxis protein methyltransferase WspC